MNKPNQKSKAAPLAAIEAYPVLIRFRQFYQAFPASSIRSTLSNISRSSQSIFQSLEKMRKKVPIIGKMAKKSSNLWKMCRSAFSDEVLEA